MAVSVIFLLSADRVGPTASLPAVLVVVAVLVAVSVHAEPASAAGILGLVAPMVSMVLVVLEVSTNAAVVSGDAMVAVSL